MQLRVLKRWCVGVEAVWVWRVLHVHCIGAAELFRGSVEAAVWECPLLAGASEGQ